MSFASEWCKKVNSTSGCFCTDKFCKAFAIESTKIFNQKVVQEVVFNSVLFQWCPQKDIKIIALLLFKDNKLQYEYIPITVISHILMKVNINIVIVLSENYVLEYFIKRLWQKGGEDSLLRLIL